MQVVHKAGCLTNKLGSPVGATPKSTKTRRNKIYSKTTDHPTQHRSSPRTRAQAIGFGTLFLAVTKNLNPTGSSLPSSKYHSPSRSTAGPSPSFRLIALRIFTFPPPSHILLERLLPTSACHLTYELTGAGIPLTSAQLYGGCYLGDLRATLLYIRQQYPDAPLLGIGFSLGANLLLKYVEEEGDQCRLRSATVLGCVRPFLVRWRIRTGVPITLVLTVHCSPGTSASTRTDSRSAGSTETYTQKRSAATLSTSSKPICPPSPNSPLPTLPHTSSTSSACAHRR